MRFSFDTFASRCVLCAQRRSGTMAGMGWQDRPENYDEVEQRHFGWLQSDLGGYLALHEALAGFLPQNFLVGGYPLADGDERATRLHGLGFLNYSVVVNVLLAKAESERAGEEWTTVLDVYGHLSAFFLRLGAAIDIAMKFETAFRA